MQILIPYESEVDLPFIRAWKSSIETILQIIRNKLLDKFISVEDRWEMYLLIRPYLKVDSCYHDFRTLEEIREVSWYDDFYLEREETMELDDDFIIKATKEFDLNTEQVNALRTEVLEYAYEKGYGAFKNDW